MKALFPCLLLLLSATLLQAQSDKYGSATVNHVYALSGDSLINLENTDAHLMIKPAAPFAKAEEGYSIKGDKSSVRLKAADSLRFMIKTPVSLDASVVRLYPLRPKKSNRDAVLGTHQDMYFHSKSEDNTKGIPFNVQKVGNDTYIITPGTKLSSGEYGFLNLSSGSGHGPGTHYDMYAFGVD